MIGDKVKILIDDPMNRFKKGDEGKLLKHPEKEHTEFEHCVEVEKLSKYGNKIYLIFYFSKSEVEVIK